MNGGMSVPDTYPYDFDPTYGLSLDELFAIEPPALTARFEDFWRPRYERALAVEARPRLIESEAQHPDWRVYDLSYTSTDDFPIAGWLLLPRRGPITRGLVVGHGYGGRDAPDFDLPVEETALLFPCLRGLSRSSRPPIASTSAWHVLHDIDQPERYVLGGCVEDLWVAVSVLTGLYPQVAGRIGYSGISFGGGIGALALAFEPRIARGFLEVPTFGNVPLWLTLPTTGSGHSVQLYRKRHPQVVETMSLFDAAVAARRIRIPMLVAAARFDPAVAPPCQFSIANALTTSNHHETFILDAGHFDYARKEEQHAQLAKKLRQFFKAT